MRHGSAVSGLRLVVEVLGIFAAYLIVIILIGIVGLVLAGAFGLSVSDASSEEYESLIFITFLVFPFGSLALLLLVRWLKNLRMLSWSELGIDRPGKWSQAWWQGIGLAVLAFIVSYSIGFLMEQFGFVQDLSTFQFISGNTVAFVFMATVVAWFAAAFTEEVVFRGFVMGNLVQLFGGSNIAWILAAILQGVAFGAFHLYQDVGGGVIAGTIGILFGLAYWKLQNLWPIIIAHGLVDTFAMTIFYFGLEKFI